VFLFYIADLEEEQTQTEKERKGSPKRTGNYRLMFNKGYRMSSIHHVNKNEENKSSK
jgi:hypothetical protein